MFNFQKLICVKSLNSYFFLFPSWWIRSVFATRWIEFTNLAESNILTNSRTDLHFDIFICFILHIFSVEIEENKIYKEQNTNNDEECIFLDTNLLVLKSCEEINFIKTLNPLVASIRHCLERSTCSFKYVVSINLSTIGNIINDETWVKMWT